MRPTHFATDRLPDEGRPPARAPIVDISTWNPARAAAVDPALVDEAVAPSPEDLVYEIDRHGRLVHVDSTWNRFAVANGAPELRAENVVGRPFWSFFDDTDGLIDEHRTLLDRCREREQRGTFLLRCDAPGERRLLRMWVEPLARGSYRFTSRTLAVESFDPELYQRLLQITVPAQVARCSHCNRFRVDDDWFEPEIAVRRDWERARPGRQRAMVHTLCPECRQHLRAVPRLVRTA